jgi:hypothetical protein
MNIAIEEVPIERIRAVIGDNSLLATVNMAIARFSEFDSNEVTIDQANDHFKNWVTSGSMADEDRVLLKKILSGDEDQLKILLSKYSKKIFIKWEDRMYPEKNGRSVYLRLEKPFPAPNGAITILRVKGARPKVVQNGDSQELQSHGGSGFAPKELNVDEEGNWFLQPVEKLSSAKNFDPLLLIPQGAMLKEEADLEYQLMQEGIKGKGFETDYPIAVGIWNNKMHAGRPTGFVIAGMRSEDVRITPRRALYDLNRSKRIYKILIGAPLEYVLDVNSFLKNGITRKVIHTDLNMSKRIYEMIGSSLRAYHDAGYFHRYPRVMNLGVEIGDNKNIKVILRDLDTTTTRQNMEGYDLNRVEAAYRFIDLQRVIYDLNLVTLAERATVESLTTALLKGYFYELTPGSNEFNEVLEQSVSMELAEAVVNLKESPQNKLVLNENTPFYGDVWKHLYDIAIKNSLTTMDQAMTGEDRPRMDDQDVRRFFAISEYNKSLFPIYVSYAQPGKVLYFDRFLLTQIQDFWEEGSVQAFRSNTRHILFIWAPGKRNEWQKKTGQSVKQEMRVPSNRPVRIRFIDTVEVLIGPDKYKVWVDEAKNIKIRHVEDVKGMLTGEPVSVPWEEQRSVIRKGSFKFSRRNKGEYRMDYMFSQGDSTLRWESMPASTFDYEGVHATGNAGKHNEDFGFVDASKGALALISGPTTITGIAAKTIQSSVSQTEFTQLNLNKVQSFLEKTISQVQQDIKDYRIRHPKARTDGVSISLVIIGQDAKERGLLVGVNAGNILFLRRSDKRTDLLSNDVEAGALGAQNTTSEKVLGNFIRSVNPGDMVVAVPSGILAEKVVERIISKNDDPEEIKHQLMEEAKTVSDARKETNKMTVAVLKISSDQAMAVKDRAMTSMELILGKQINLPPVAIQDSPYPELLRDIRDVGLDKMIGHLPSSVIGPEHLINQLIDEAHAKGLQSKLYNQKKAQEGSPGYLGDLFIYDRLALQYFLNRPENKGILENYHIPVDADQFVDRIERNFFEEDKYPAFYRIINQVYANPKFPKPIMDIKEIKALAADGAMKANNGGIDLTQANSYLITQNFGPGIKFYLDQSQLAQLQNAPGFVPVIINIQPLKDLSTFLELNDS